MDVQSGYERALAAALGDDIDASLHAEAPARWTGAKTPPSALPAQAQPLSHFVKAPGALSARLALIGVVTAKDGAALAPLLPPGVRLVSKQGDLWRWDGFVRRADAPQPAAARLEHKNRLAAARKEVASAEKRATLLRQAWDGARVARQEAEAQARQLRAQAPRLARADVAAQRDVERLEAEQSRLSERCADLGAQQQALAAEFAEARAAVADAEIAAQAAPAAGDDAGLTTARAVVDAARRAAAEASAEVQSRVRDRAQRTARRQAIEAERMQWQARSASAEARLRAVSIERGEAERQRDVAKTAPAAARGKLEALMDETRGAERRSADAADKVVAAQAAARHAAEAARAKEEAHAAARERRAAAQAHASAAQSRLDDVVLSAREQTGQAPRDLAEFAGGLLNAALGQAPIAEIERRMERLKAERDAAGPVNLRAVEELEEAQARIAELTKEKDDVAQAVAKLRRAITTLNSEGRTRLMRAFEQVDAHFAQLFASLFEGGQAALKLTESEDPLEAGLEIFAQPPGKRLTHLSLLSGGEQALTATALIFAVFLSNPAPLCVLDEVDAPLDDANVDRFCRLLEEMKRLTATRFLCITHNPVTMSRMDRLYGVTMPEQGLSQLVSVDLTRAQAMAAE